MGWPADPAERKNRRAAEYLKHRATYLRRNAAYKKTPAGQIADRNWRLKKRYYISAKTKEAMFQMQGGLCAICRVAPAVHTDHCHQSGVLRELLCFKCNVGLGNFKDDPALLRAAIDYLLKHALRAEAA